VLGQLVWLAFWLALWQALVCPDAPCLPCAPWHVAVLLQRGMPPSPTAASSSSAQELHVKWTSTCRKRVDRCSDLTHSHVNQVSILYHNAASSASGYVAALLHLDNCQNETMLQYSDRIQFNYCCSCPLSLTAAFGLAFLAFCPTHHLDPPARLVCPHPVVCHPAWPQTGNGC
jgi:hypothetical protein